MCFQLYAGTERPLPRSKWNRSDPHVYACDLNESDSWIKSIFSKPEIQYIGSTTCCGCAFPFGMHQNGGWPCWLDPVVDAEAIASNQLECKELCELLSQLDEDKIELYGVWAGNKDKEPLISEEVTLNDIRRQFFCFKEGGFYRVKLR